MRKYLVDANLPYHFSIWNSKEYIHQFDIDDSWSDSKIWDYATEQNLTIITRDSDFSHRILFHNPPPKVIHIKLGNKKLRDLFKILFSNWEVILELSSTHKLVNVFDDRIEAIE